MNLVTTNSDRSRLAVININSRQKCQVRISTFSDEKAAVEFMVAIATEFKHDNIDIDGLGAERHKLLKSMGAPCADDPGPAIRQRPAAAPCGDAPVPAIVKRAAAAPCSDAPVPAPYTRLDAGAPQPICCSGALRPRRGGGASTRAAPRRRSTLSSSSS